MLTIALSSIVFLLLVWRFVIVTAKYHRYQQTYGEFAVNSIPSTKQARRYAELKTLKYQSLAYLIAIFAVMLFIGYII